MSIRFHERAWSDLLQSYEWQEARLQADIRTLVRYLKSAIAANKRNPGALKLSNVLQLDRFDEDLAEAKVMQPRRSSPGNANLHPGPPEPPRADDDAERQERTRKLREFRKSL